jgi:hypothetical protein
MTIAALAGIDQRSVLSLSCRTTAIIASRQPQPQSHMPTRKTGKDPDYQNSQSGTVLPQERCVGHLSAGPAASSYPNISQDQRTTDPRYQHTLGANRIHPLTAAKCQASSGLVDATVMRPASLSPNITYHSDRSGITFQGPEKDHKVTPRIFLAQRAASVCFILSPCKSILPFCS